MKTFEGKFNGKGLKIGIVAGRFNEFITSKLIAGAKDALIRHGVKEENIDLAWVPGAFEIPLVAQKMAKTKKCLNVFLLTGNLLNFICIRIQRSGRNPTQGTII